MNCKGLIIGAILFMGGVAPSFAAYVPVSDITSFTGSHANTILMRDDDLTSSGYIYWTSNNQLWIYTPAGMTAGVWRVTMNCADGAKKKAFTIYYEDGTSAGPSLFYSTDSVTGTFYSQYGYPTKALRSPESGPSAIMSLDGTSSGLCYVYEISSWSPNNPYSQVITSETISALLSNATFQTTITSITAVSEIADFMTFKGTAGGVHSWIWGAIFMLSFYAGLYAGFRSL